MNISKELFTVTKVKNADLKIKIKKSNKKGQTY